MAEAQRLLTTIVAADIAGFSRLVGIDEEATLAAQRNHRAELIEPLLAEYHGRVANTAGDSFLFEFSSTVEAVRCAIAMQEGMAERNRDTSVDRRIEYRIGINLGDVISDGGDLLGDGVNVAARLEGLAEPGGICLSRAARDQVRDRSDIAFEDLGEIEVKNIARPIRVFRVLGKGETASAPTRRTANKRNIYIAAALMLAFIAGGVLWQQPWVTRVESASQERMAYPLPNRPSVAVLPFDNVMADDSQAPLIKGLTGDIIGALSRLTELFVIDQRSTQTYAGATVSVRQAAEDLGVRYVVTGGVERDGDRLRVTVQLIDALTGEIIWSERYERTIKDLFAVRDDITRRIVAAVGVKIGSGEQSVLRADQAMGLEAWLLMKEASEFANEPSPENLRRGREIMERVIEMEPDVASTYLWLSVLTRLEVQIGTSENPEVSMQIAWDMARKAKELDPENEGVYAALSNLYVMSGQHDEGIAAIKRAVELGPNVAAVVGTGAMVYYYAGDFDEAIRHGRRALRMLPRSRLHWIMAHKALAQQMNGDLEGAANVWQEILATDPDTYWVGVANLQMALIDAEHGDDAKARKLVADALAAAPYLTQTMIRLSSPMRDPKALDPWMETLDRLGLPAK